MPEQKKLLDDLLNACASKEPSKVAAAFGDLMTGKTYERIQAERQDVAMTMNQPSDEPVSEAKLERRHFEAIAADLKSKGANHEEVHAMADKLAKTNPGFRRDFFVAASTGGSYNNKSGGRKSKMNATKPYMSGDGK